ncbi:MAG: hypothetical protein NTZ59_01800 [Bacteroidetes bacterium]|nr:hypothetical protein [Bacteroidota bacterium]
MKYLAFCFTLSIAIVACKKETTTNEMVTTSPFQNSKWELRKSEGGNTGTLTYLPGNGQTIEFFGVDSFISIYPTSSISYIDSGIYTIATANTAGDFYLQKKYYVNGMLITINDSVRVLNNQLIFLSRYGGAACDPTFYYDRL